MSTFNKVASRYEEDDKAEEVIDIHLEDDGFKESTLMKNVNKEQVISDVADDPHNKINTETNAKDSEGIYSANSRLVQDSS